MQIVKVFFILTILYSCNQQEYTIPHFDIGSDTITYNTSSNIDMVFKVEKEEQAFNRKIESSFSLTADTSLENRFHLNFQHIQVASTDGNEIVKHTIRKTPIQFGVMDNKLDSISNWELDMNVILQSPDSLLSIIAHKESEVLILNNLWNHFTSQAIHINSKWKDSLKFEMNGILHHFDLIYKLDKVVENLAYIQLTGTVNPQIFPNEYNKENGKITGNFEGKIIVDLRSGMLMSGDFNSELKISGKKNNQQFALSITGFYKLSVQETN